MAVRKPSTPRYTAKNPSIPTIEADVGDTVVVNVKNSLGTQSTSLHFHGMYQQGKLTFGFRLALG